MPGQCLLSINTRRRFLPRAAAERLPKELAIGNLVTFDIAQHRTPNARIGWRMPPPPDKGKCRVTIYPITIYHRFRARSHRGGLACCGCRGHVAVSSIRVLSIALRVCRDVAVHLAKGAEKAAAALITGRSRDPLRCARKFVRCLQIEGFGLAADFAPRPNAAR